MLHLVGVKMKIPGLHTLLTFPMWDHLCIIHTSVNMDSPFLVWK